jgi:hypothetical protein
MFISTVPLLRLEIESVGEVRARAETGVRAVTMPKRAAPTSEIPRIVFLIEKVKFFMVLWIFITYLPLFDTVLYDVTKPYITEQKQYLFQAYH